MANGLLEEQTLVDIADAIRTKGGPADLMYPSQFADAILNLEGGGTGPSSFYGVEFGEVIGNGTLYFTQAYQDKPFFHIHPNDGSTGTVTLKQNPSNGSYVGATLSGVNTSTTTLCVFYCTNPVVS